MSAQARANGLAYAWNSLTVLQKDGRGAEADVDRREISHVALPSPDATSLITEQQIDPG